MNFTLNSQVGINICNAMHKITIIDCSSSALLKKYIISTTVILFLVMCKNTFYNRFLLQLLNKFDLKLSSYISKVGPYLPC